RQSECHGQPTARLNSLRISPGWIQLNEPEMCRRARPLAQSQYHFPLHHFDGLPIQGAIRPTSGDEYRQALSPGRTMRVATSVGAGSLNDPYDATIDLSYEFLIGLDDFVQRLAISLPEVIGRFNRFCVVPRKIKAKSCMAVVA